MTGRREVLAAIRAGRTPDGPRTVHVDLTNTCNARCLACWDHSPLLGEPRSPEWKARRLSFEAWVGLASDLGRPGTVRSVVISGMGEPLTHPDALAVVRDARARGWHVTLITNLMAGDPDALAASGVDRVLAGVHGVTPASWAAFHPGWEEEGFHELCRRLRVLGRAGVETRHVHVIAAPNVGELAGMVRFGAVFRADRVNLKLAALGRGTEAIALSRSALADLHDRAIPEARALAAHLGVRTTLGLLARQVTAALASPGATTSMMGEPCRMGQVYARVTADREVLFCCDPEARVGALGPGASFGDLWSGPAWRSLRERVAAGERLPGCATCGKYEQNLAWNEAIG